MLHFLPLMQPLTQHGSMVVYYACGIAFVDALKPHQFQCLMYSCHGLCIYDAVLRCMIRCLALAYLLHMLIQGRSSIIAAYVGAATQTTLAHEPPYHLQKVLSLLCRLTYVNIARHDLLSCFDGFDRMYAESLRGTVYFVKYIWSA